TAATSRYRPGSAFPARLLQGRPLWSLDLRTAPPPKDDHKGRPYNTVRRPHLPIATAAPALSPSPWRLLRRQRAAHRWVPRIRPAALGSQGGRYSEGAPRWWDRWPPRGYRRQSARDYLRPCRADRTIPPVRHIPAQRNLPL